MEINFYFFLELLAEELTRAGPTQQHGPSLSVGPGGGRWCPNCEREEAEITGIKGGKTGKAAASLERQIGRLPTRPEQGDVPSLGASRRLLPSPHHPTNQPKVPSNLFLGCFCYFFMLVPILLGVSRASERHEIRIFGPKIRVVMMFVSLPVCVGCCSGSVACYWTVFKYGEVRVLLFNHGNCLRDSLCVCMLC